MRPRPSGNQARLIAIMRTRELTASMVASILRCSEQYVRMLRTGIRSVSDDHIERLERELGIKAVKA